jgi:hypothetical protein
MYSHETPRHDKTRGAAHQDEDASGMTSSRANRGITVHVGSNRTDYRPDPETAERFSDRKCAHQFTSG